MQMKDTPVPIRIINDRFRKSQYKRRSLFQSNGAGNVTTNRTTEQGAFPLQKNSVTKPKLSPFKQMIVGSVLLGAAILIVSMAVLFFWRWFLS
jgi:hypothetical protein